MLHNRVFCNMSYDITSKFQGLGELSFLKKIQVTQNGNCQRKKYFTEWNVTNIEKKLKNERNPTYLTHLPIIPRLPYALFLAKFTLMLRHFVCKVSRRHKLKYFFNGDFDLFSYCDGLAFRSRVWPADADHPKSVVIGYSSPTTQISTKWMRHLLSFFQ